MEPGGAAAAAAFMETGDAFCPEGGGEISEQGGAEGSVSQKQPLKTDLVGASSNFPPTDGGMAASNSEAPMFSFNKASQGSTLDDPKMKASQSNKSHSGVGRKVSDSSVKRKFSDMEDEEGEDKTSLSPFLNVGLSTSELQVPVSSVVETAAESGHPLPENEARPNLASQDKPSVSVTSALSKKVREGKKETDTDDFKTQKVEDVNAQKKKEALRRVMEAERKEYERKIASRNLASLWEMKFQLHLASLHTPVQNKGDDNEAPECDVIPAQTATESCSDNESRERMSVTLAGVLKDDCQKLCELKTAHEAEKKFWESNQDNSHGRRKDAKSNKKSFPKDEKKTKFASDNEDIEKNREQAKAIFRKRGTKSMSEDTSEIKRGELKKTRAYLSMSDIQNNVDDAKLTYAEMVIKGEKDRRRRFEATLSHHLVEEYKNIARLQAAIMCETSFQKSLVMKKVGTPDKEDDAATKHTKKKFTPEKEVKKRASSEKEAKKKVSPETPEKEKKMKAERNAQSRREVEEVDPPNKPVVDGLQNVEVSQLKSSRRPGPERRPAERVDTSSTDNQTLPAEQNFTHRLKVNVQ